MGVTTLLPTALLPAVTDALRACGDASPIRSLSAVKGGYSSHALRIVTAKGTYFLKWNDHANGGRYTAEVRSLALLAQSGTVKVPEVLGAADATVEAPGYLLLEWLVPPARDVFLRRVGERLGAPVAALHRAGMIDGAPAPGYGREPRAYVHGWVVVDGWEPDWVRFYREQCLLPLIERAERIGRLTPARRQGLDRLLGKLDNLLGAVDRQPALLHGDLWRNNVQCNRRGELVLIDPLPFFGDREAELAYTEYAGGFPPAFYAAYEAAWPTEPGRTERRDLYMLWYMLRDLNAGTPQKVLAVDAIVRWYAGA